jgi:hypothetical protein
MKAIIAVAASMLTSAFHMLTTGADYKDLGAAHLESVTTPRSPADSFAGSKTSA